MRFWIIVFIFQMEILIIQLIWKIIKGPKKLKTEEGNNNLYEKM